MLVSWECVTHNRWRYWFQIQAIPYKTLFNIAPHVIDNGQPFSTHYFISLWQNRRPFKCASSRRNSRHVVLVVVVMRFPVFISCTYVFDLWCLMGIQPANLTRETTNKNTERLWLASVAETVHKLAHSQRGAELFDKSILLRS